MKAAPKPDRTFEVYPDTSSSWRWRTRAKNGQITAVSGESFHSQGNALRAAKRECRAMQQGVVVVEVAAA